MAGQFPVLSYAKDADKKPIPTRRTTDKRWQFSFRFWRQIDFFGIGNVDTKWFASLLDRLKDLSEKKLSEFLSDGAQRDAYRYHSIDWNAKNIPIQRKDLNWIDSDYLENHEEYPLVQVHISKGLGRIVGFWDQENVFNIVLLDPLHNLQPAKDFDYKVDPTNLLSCHYSALLADIKNLTYNQHATCSSPTCGFKGEINQLPRNDTYTNVLIHFIDDDFKSRYQKLLDYSLANSSLEIFQYGVMYLEDENKQ